MLIFISGSINSGKTTTSEALAKKLGWEYINVDDITDHIKGFNIYTHLDIAMDEAIKAINTASEHSKHVVANFVLREQDWKRLEQEVHIHPQVIITLSPPIEVAQSQRGDRVLTDWEIKRIKSHYDDGIASPQYGHTIDNSNLTVSETVDRIIDIANII